VPVVGLPFEDVVVELWSRELAWLGEDVAWFDAHTHIGHHDPDGFEADPQELIAALDVAGQQRALVFAMQEPDGYRAPNDWVLRSCVESNGRLVPLARIDPKAPDAMEEARRCLAAGARGFKLHPRSDGFVLPHPVVEELVALAGEHRLPVLFHAGRGIPDLGDPIVHLATEHPGARLILAHAGISDLGLLAPHVGRLPNILFDTSWWHVSDLLALFATVPPGQILYASDMPYGGPRYPALLMLRCARAVGLTPEQVADSYARPGASEDDRVCVQPLQVRIVRPAAQIITGLVMGGERHPGRPGGLIRRVGQEDSDLLPVGLVVVDTAKGRPPVVHRVQEPVLQRNETPVAGDPAIVRAGVRVGL